MWSAMEALLGRSGHAAPRRVAARVAADSPQAVIVRLLHDLMAHDGGIHDAAERLAAREGVDADVLARARARIRRLSLGRASVLEARAVATIDQAIELLHARDLRGTEPVGPGDGG